MGERAKPALGWGRLENSGKIEYSIKLQTISDEEEQMLCTCIENFGEIAKKHEVCNRDEAEKIARAVLLDECKNQEIELEEDQEEYLTDYLLMHVWGFCYLDKLLEDERIEEIAVVGIGKPTYVYLYEKGWKKTDFGFSSEQVAIETINKMARTIGRRITYQTPRLNAVLPDGTRLHATIPPISKTEITLRKFRSKPITAPQLGALRTASFEALAFLWLVMQSDASVLVCGNTASGKTTTLNALFNFIHLSERVLVLEETPEINIPHVHVARLLSQDELGIGMGELVSDSLRMRPDRVIVGEVRTQEETQSLVESILSGQARGTYATYHAQSAKEACLRFVAQGVLPVDLSSIDLFVVQRRIGRYKKGAGVEEIRRVVQIAETGTISETRDESDIWDETRSLFAYDWKKDTLVQSRKIERSRICEKICRAHAISPKELQHEIARRSRFLKKLSWKKMGLEQTTKAILEFG